MLYKSALKRELILDRAEQVFIRKGFNRVTMKDIIEECGISRGGVYLYFSTIDEIFMEVIKRHKMFEPIKSTRWGAFLEFFDDKIQVNDIANWIFMN